MHVCLNLSSEYQARLEAIADSERVKRRVSDEKIGQDVEALAVFDVNSGGPDQRDK